MKDGIEEIEKKMPECNERHSFLTLHLGLEEKPLTRPQIQLAHSSLPPSRKMGRWGNEAA